jgi:ABC-type amino acid transport substrate-binding protein
MTKRWWIYIVIGIGAIIIYRLFFYKGKVEAPVIRDYNEIVASDTLRVTMEYNAFSITEGNDSIEGFYLELVQAFARDHNLELQVMPEMSIARRLQGLQEGRYDVIADGIPITAERDDSLLLISRPIMRSYQVLVQRKPLNTEDSAKYISSQVMLAGKTLHIIKDSPVMMRINNLMSEIGDNIHIESVDKYGAEQLIALVAHSDIDYAVCDHRIALLATDSLPNIDISIPIGFSQFYAWGINPHSPILCDSINSWLETYMQSKAFKTLAKKYAIN